MCFWGTLSKLLSNCNFNILSFFLFLHKPHLQHLLQMSVLCSSRAISLLRMLLRPRPLILHIRTANDLDPFCVCCTALLQITDLDKTVCFGVWFLQLRFQPENYLGTTPSLRWWCWHFRAEKYWIFYSRRPRTSSSGGCMSRSRIVRLHLCPPLWVDGSIWALFCFVPGTTPLPSAAPGHAVRSERKERGVGY